MTNGLIVNLDALNKELQMLSSKELTKIEKNSIRKGLNVIKKEARKSLKAKLPAASKSNSKYNDTLMQGIIGSVKEQGDSSLVGKVHILGNGKSGSGTFRLRFFETGTIHKSSKGTWGINQPDLYKKKKHTNGKFNFFDSAYSASASKSTNAMFDELTKRILEINNG